MRTDQLLYNLLCPVIFMCFAIIHIFFQGPPNEEFERRPSEASFESERYEPGVPGFSFRSEKELK